ncbi:MAG TPA: hypothetical protein QGI71_09310 [Dehalococcoidia bacterium]|nr:hypothetical protein [Dehalococcoidia bacterium]
MGAIYQRFGYGAGTTQVHYEIDPRYAAFEDGERSPGTVSLVALDDAKEIMERVYIEHARPRNLMCTAPRRCGRRDGVRRTS